MNNITPEFADYIDQAFDWYTEGTRWVPRRVERVIPDEFKYWFDKGFKEANAMVALHTSLDIFRVAEYAELARTFAASARKDINDLPDVVGADMVNHPPHYTSHPSGVECIQITKHMTFCAGNAVKYLWRADEKGAQVQDLRKAIWYIECEIERIEGESNDT